MASGIFAVLDDIAYLMDDIATSTKMAAKKTSAVLGDDLAVSAEKTTGYSADRELPVIWAIIKGSFVNKLIILPVIFAFNYFAPFLIKLALLIGGLYLAYEGTEKIIDYFFHKEEIKKEKPLTEEEKIKSAIATDFILSLEIVIIALSTVINEPFFVQVISVSVVSFLATIGVYGLVALIVRMDDIGLSLMDTGNPVLRKIGYFLVIALPKVIKVLSVVGTVAMLTVAGGIYIHNIEVIHHYLNLPFGLGEIIVGFILGTVVFSVKSIFKKAVSYFSQ